MSKSETLKHDNTTNITDGRKPNNRISHHTEGIHPLIPLVMVNIFDNIFINYLSVLKVDAV